MKIRFDALGRWLAVSPSTASAERCCVGIETTNYPINPDFDARTDNLEIVRRRHTFLAAVVDNHLFSSKSNEPQNRTLERVPSRDCHRRRHAGGIIHNDKAIRQVKARFTLNRGECFGAFDGGLSEQCSANGE